MQNAIKCRGVSKGYPRFTLNDIDLQVPEGSVMGLVGPWRRQANQTHHELQGRELPHE